MSASVISRSQLPLCAMKRIIVHWTAGGYTASELDREHYHFIIQGDGSVITGQHSIQDNINTNGSYAAHTRGCNSGSIGVSVAAMAGAIELPFSAGKYPLKEIQWNMLINVVAQLCHVYDIPLTPRTVLSHAEVQQTLGIPQRGKWDITRLPFNDKVKGAKSCGDLLRKQVADAIKLKAVV